MSLASVVSRSARTACCGLLLVASLVGVARADWSVVSTSETTPGELVMRIDPAGEPPPQASELSLRLGTDAVVPADRVTPASASPPALMLCLDRSGSMGPRVVADMRVALRQALLPNGATGALPLQLGIIAFGTRSTYLLPPTTDRAAASRALDLLVVERGREGRTRLYDAVAGGLVELRATGTGARRLVVVSDGNDEGSDLPESTVLARAAAAPTIAVDSIAFGSQAAGASGSLAALSRATGGRFTVAGDSAALVTSLRTAIAQTASASQVDVVFRYAPAAGEQRVSDATLVYRAPGSAAPREWKVAQAVAAPAAAPAAAPSTPGAAGTPPGSAASAGGAGGHLWRGLVGAGLLVLLVLAALIAWIRHRRPAVDALDTTALPVDADEPSALDTRPSPRPQTRVAFQWAAPGAQRTLAVLETAAGAHSGRRFEMTTARAGIGSAADNVIAVTDDEFMSGHHAELRAESNALYVADLGSTNGSELNGRRFMNSIRSLSPGDRLTVGRTVFLVLSPEAAAERASPGVRAR